MSLAGAKMGKLAAVGLTGLAIALAAQLALRPDWTPPRVKALAPQSTAGNGAEPSKEPPPFGRFQSLAQSRMFGPGPARRTAAAGPARGLPRTKPKIAPPPRFSGYRLVGLMSGSAALSMAVVENSQSGIQEVVSLGDRLGSGRVIEIGDDHMVINVQGKHHQLVMRDDSEKQVAEVMTIQADNNSPVRRTRRAAAVAPPKPTPKAEPEPDRSGGKLKTSPGSAGRLDIISPGPLSSLGLIPGDSVVAGTPKDIEAAMDDLADGRTTQLDLNRAGRRLKVRFAPL